MIGIVLIFDYISAAKPLKSGLLRGLWQACIDTEKHCYQGLTVVKSVHIPEFCDLKAGIILHVAQNVVGSAIWSV